MSAVQQSLWPALVEPDYAPELSLDERFDLFHAANPHVADRLRALALELVDAGRTRVGIKMLWEVLRWQQAVETTGEPYRLDNSLTSRYARFLADTTPELAGVFETRALACERAR